MKKLIAILFFASSLAAQVQIGKNVQIGAATSVSPFVTSLTTTGTSGPSTVTAGVLNIPQYAGSTFITSLTTTGSSGAATVASGVLNIPQYSGGTVTTSGTPTTNTLAKFCGPLIICNSGLTDDGTKLAYTGSGTANGVAFAASSTPITPAAATAIYESDALGNTVVSENGAAASRICTAANGICASGSAITPEYMTTSQSPLGSWTRALDNCSNQVVHLAMLWDSYGIAYQGFGSTGPTNYYDRVPDQLFSYLKSRCPVHGTGLVPPIGYLVPGSPLPNPLYFAFSGTAGFSTALGPWTSVGSTLMTAQVGNVLTFTTSTTAIATDTVNVYCAQGPGYGTWNISVDSGAHTGTCGGSAGSPTAQLVSVTEGTSATTHSVALTCATAQCYLWAVDGTNGSVGFEVDNVSFGSGNSTMWSQVHAFDFLDLIPGGIQGMVVKFQTNEPNQSVTTSQYTTALEAIATHEQATASNPGIGIFTAPVSNPAGGCGMGSTMASYSAAALTAATTSGMAYTDILHNWGTTYLSPLFASDGCHPTEAGTFSEFALTKRMMIDVEPTPSNASISVPTTSNVLNAPSGTLAAIPGISYFASGAGGSNSNCLQFTGAGGPFPSYLCTLVGQQNMFSFNTYYNGTIFQYVVNGPAGAFRQLQDGSHQGYELNLCESGTAGGSVPMGTTCMTQWSQSGTSGTQTWFNPGTETPTFPTNAALVANPSANWYVDFSGNEHAASVNGTVIPSSVTLTQTIASGTSALGTSAIASGACATAVTTTATGVASTDAISWNPNGSIKAVTGYIPSTAGGLTIAGYPTTNAVNWDVCNWTAASITPGAVTLNWRVTR